MFVSQVTRTTTSFTWIIFITTSLLINITNVVLLIFKRWRFLLLLLFSKSVIIYSFAFLLGLSGSWILCGFLSFILARNKLFIWCYNWCTFSMSIHTRKTLILFSNIYFCGVFYFGTFYKINWPIKYTLIYLLILLCILFQFF